MSMTASDRAPSTKTEAFVDKCRVAPYAQGTLTGLTFGVKDIIDIAGRPTGCGNPDWREKNPPATCHAVCIEQLLSQGALCLGKTVTDEMAFDLLGENHFYGTPLNSKAPDRVPGGSSSGSAAAVAGGDIDFAIGTDTAGSVRVPASNCGLFGYRPSHGRVSVAGVHPLAPTFDTVGAFATTAENLAKIGAVLLSTGVPTSPTVRRFLVVQEGFEIASEAVRQALAKPLSKIVNALQLKQEVLSIRRIDRQPRECGLADWLENYRTVSGAEIWSCGGAWIESAHPSFGPRIARNFEYAKQIDRTKVAAAVRFRETLFNRCLELLDEGDILCIPTVPEPAPLRGSIGIDRYQNDYLVRLVSLTSIASICRLPQISLPLAEVDGAPVGISLLARHGNDITVLGAMQHVCRQLG